MSRLSVRRFFVGHRRHVTSLVAAALTATSLLPLSLTAQEQRPPIQITPQRPRAVTDTSIFAPLVLPTANEMRAGSGAPGVRYWQNRADYALAATLDTAAKTVFGAMTLRYTNNSPDTLRFLWLQTEQNAFKANLIPDSMTDDRYYNIKRMQRLKLR